MSVVIYTKGHTQAGMVKVQHEGVAKGGEYSASRSRLEG